MKLFDRDFCIDICPENKNPYVKMAIEDLRHDFERVSLSHHLPKFTNTPQNGCIVIKENTGRISDPILDESFTIECKDDRIIVSANGYLGTIWGIYTISEKFLQVMPCYLFNDIPTKVSEKIEIENTVISDRPKTFGFRGVFINDEDFLTEWKEGGGIRKINYRYYATTVPDEVMNKVAETILRLKLNLIIPASLIDIDNPPEKALVDCFAKRGIYISQHHIEPLGVSSYTFDVYCREHGIEATYSYIENPEVMEEVWKYYAKKWAGYEHVVWQIGLRGISDRPLWQEDTPAEEELQNYGRIISGVYQKQKDIIMETTGGKASHFTSTLWMEGSDLCKKGYLTFPENTTIVLADTGPNQMYGKDFYEKRLSGYSYGIYYHVAYIGIGPHYCPETGLDKLFYNLDLAKRSGDTDCIILNISNVREFTYEIGAYSQMVWNIEKFSKENYEKNYCRYFGEFSEEVRLLIHRYYGLLPEIDKKLLPYLHGKYFTYMLSDTAVPDGVKNFVIKEGTVIYYAKKLIEFFATPGFENPVYTEVYKALVNILPEYEKLRKDIAKIAMKMNEPLKKTLEVTWLLYTETLYFIDLWYIRLYEAKLEKDKGNIPASRENVQEGIESLEEYLRIRKKAEYGDFENWYRGDRKLDIQRRLNLTRGLPEE